MYHSVDSQSLTGEANVSLHVNKLPRYVRARYRECSVLYLLFVLYLHCEPKKGGSTFNIITLENTLDSYNFCNAVSRKKRFTHS